MAAAKDDSEWLNCYAGPPEIEESEHSPLPVPRLQPGFDLTRSGATDQISSGETGPPPNEQDEDLDEAIPLPSNPFTKAAFNHAVRQSRKRHPEANSTKEKETGNQRLPDLPQPLKPLKREAEPLREVFAKQVSNALQQEGRPSKAAKVVPAQTFFVKHHLLSKQPAPSSSQVCSPHTPIKPMTPGEGQMKVNAILTPKTPTSYYDPPTRREESPGHSHTSSTSQATASPLRPQTPLQGASEAPTSTPSRIQVPHPVHLYQVAASTSQDAPDFVAPFSTKPSTAFCRSSHVFSAGTFPLAPDLSVFESHRGKDDSPAPSPVFRSRLSTPGPFPSSSLSTPPSQESTETSFEWSTLRMKPPSARTYAKPRQQEARKQRGATVLPGIVPSSSISYASQQRRLRAFEPPVPLAEWRAGRH